MSTLNIDSRSVASMVARAGAEVILRVHILRPQVSMICLSLVAVDLIYASPVDVDPRVQSTFC